MLVATILGVVLDNVVKVSLWIIPDKEECQELHTTHPKESECTCDDTKHKSPGQDLHGESESLDVHDAQPIQKC
jgi:hypothetical protein